METHDEEDYEGSDCIKFRLNAYCDFLEDSFTMDSNEHQQPFEGIYFFRSSEC